MMKLVLIASLMTTAQCIKLSPRKPPPGQDARTDSAPPQHPAGSLAETSADNSGPAYVPPVNPCNFPTESPSDSKTLWWAADTSYAWEGLSCDEMCWGLSAETENKADMYICDQDML